MGPLEHREVALLSLGFEMVVAIRGGPALLLTLMNARVEGLEALDEALLRERGWLMSNCRAICHF
jgi:hypothetical protein